VKYLQDNATGTQLAFPDTGAFQILTDDALGFTALLLGPESADGMRLDFENTGSALAFRRGDDTDYVDIKGQNVLFTGYILIPEVRDSASKWDLGSSGQMMFASDAIMYWSSTTVYTGIKDLGLERASAGVLQVTNGSTGVGQLDANLYTIAGITASVTQTQGQGPLTAIINVVATVANPNDTVTLPSAAAGRRCVVVNTGANTLQIFPASGDDLGAGVNTATTMAAGFTIDLLAYDATTWIT
jgi:hypothetical protein